PAVEVLPAHAERLLDRLVRPRQIAVERDRDLETNDAHGDLLGEFAVSPTYNAARRTREAPRVRGASLVGLADRLSCSPSAPRSRGATSDRSAPSSNRRRRR